MSADDVLRLFGDNVIELLAYRQSLKTTSLRNITELFDTHPEIKIEDQKHRPVGDFVQPKSKLADYSSRRAIKILVDNGFVEHFVLQEDEFLNSDTEILRMCCDGTRQFQDEWVSFRCRRERVVVFAFRNTADAVMLRMHL